MKIMIVEDDRASQCLLEKLVADLGHEIVTAANGREAWDRYQAQPVQMVITDWLMPEMDGLELCKLIRERSDDPYIYIITLTARSSKADLAQVFEVGADDYIAKPVDTDELKARIRAGERIVALEDRHRRFQERLLKSAAQLEAKNASLEETLAHLETTKAQIIQQEKMATIGQLAAGVAHEIKNPTGFVDSNLVSLQDYMTKINHLVNGYKLVFQRLNASPSRTPLSADVAAMVAEVQAEAERIDIDYLQEDVQDLIQDCREGTRRIKKIVLDLKAFAHPGEEQLQFADINKGLKSTLNVVNTEIKYKAKVITDFGDLPMVECYPQELNQVFMNLLTNAAQAMETRGEIRVSTRRLAEQVRIEISDTGVGIEPANLDKIFDPFFTTKAVGKGTGLGMHIAYNIIQKHNGAIQVESTPGEGTTFTIDLPVLGENAH
jgi:signal transduction histidine kinase